MSAPFVTIKVIEVMGQLNQRPLPWKHRWVSGRGTPAWIIWNSAG